MTLTLPALHCLALKWCPEPARWEWLLDKQDPEWGSGHEIAHALISKPEERVKYNYGLCDAWECTCPGEPCHVNEVAAMISAKLHRTIGRPDIIATEAEAIDGYDDFISPGFLRRARRLLERQGLTRIPRTVAGLERLLRMRLA